MEVASNVSGSLHDELVIVLHISEAIGLNNAEMVWAQASLSGNKLDREPIKTGHTTSFECSLIWETDRRSIRRMKTENLPVKIDLYGIKNYRGDINVATKEHIGYVLLPVRGIPMLSVHKAVKTKCRWMKLIGLSKEFRTHKPELLINIMITEKEYLTVDKNKIQEIQSFEAGESIIFEENPNPSMMTSQKGIFVRLIQKEGLLQVGNIDTECDIFSVRLLIQNVKHLDNIVPECSNESMSRRDFFINYILLGNNHSRKLDRKFNRTHQIHEKISINFRASLKSLHDYFQHIFYVPIEIHLDNNIVGSGEISLHQIIQIFNLREFIEKYPKGQEYDGVVEIKTPIALEAPNRPILEYKVLILYHASRKLHQLEFMDNTKTREVEIDEMAGGDCIMESNLHENKDQNINESHSGSDKSSLVQVKSVGIGKKKALSAAENNPLLVSKNSFVQSEKNEATFNIQDNGDIPRLFSYNLQVKTMKFNKKPQKGIWQISFFHEMADTPRTFINRDIHENDIDGHFIAFKDLELKLYFTSYSENIMDLVKSSHECTLCIRGPHKTHAKAYIDCRNLFIKDKTCGNILLTNQNETVSALAEICVYLDDCGINFNAKKLQTDVPEFEENNDTKDAQKELFFDESIAHKMIDELEEWKEQQQKKFLMDLKCTEQKYLDKFKNDFKTLKASYENRFNEKNKELEMLTKTLEDAHESIKEKNIQSARNEDHVQKMKIEMEQSHAHRLQTIKERTQQLEKDFMREINMKNMKIEELECSNKQLHEKLSFLTLENCDLKENVECLNAKYESLKANLVPKDEVENLIQEMRSLQEKFEAAVQSKNFYKEQWAKSFRECHKIRRENTCDRKNELFNSKCDRLCDVLSDESNKLNFEKEELEEIKHCLSLDEDSCEL